MKIVILIPVFNDFKSASKLIEEIDINISELKAAFSVIVVNDASTEEKILETKNLNNIKSLKLINMRNNKGHARCIAAGLKHISENEDFDYVIPMDGDGEDRPEEIIDLVDKIQLNPEASVVAKRVKRSEGFFFKYLYLMHKILTLIFTGKKVNFGNYSCLTKKDVVTLSQQESLWSSFSGTLRKSISRLNTINSTRGLRYFGPSKMSLFNLVVHSFSIIAVFKSQVFLRGLIFGILIYLFKGICFNKFCL